MMLWVKCEATLTDANNATFLPLRSCAVLNRKWVPSNCLTLAANLRSIFPRKLLSPCPLLPVQKSLKRFLLPKSYRAIISYLGSGCASPSSLGRTCRPFATIPSSPSNRLQENLQNCRWVDPDLSCIQICLCLRANTGECRCLCRCDQFLLHSFRTYRCRV